MDLKYNRTQANSALGVAIAYFTLKSYTVSIPLNDTQDYDLIIEKNHIFQSVQVKSSRCKTKYGNFQVALRSCGGTKGIPYKTLINTSIDFLFILTQNNTIYLIPKSDISNKNTITLSDKYSKYRIIL